MENRITFSFLIGLSFLVVSCKLFKAAPNSSGVKEDADKGAEFSVFVYDKNGKELESAKVSLSSTLIDSLDQATIVYKGNTISLMVGPEKGRGDPVSGEETGQTKYFVDSLASPSMVLGLGFELQSREINRNGELIIYKTAAASNSEKKGMLLVVNEMGDKLGKAEYSYAAEQIDDLKSVRIKFESISMDLRLAADGGNADPVSGEQTGQSKYFADNTSANPKYVLKVDFEVLSRKITGVDGLIKR